MLTLLLLSYRCNVTINVLWLFLTVPWVGLHCVIVVFPDHTHLIFAISEWCYNEWNNVIFSNNFFVKLHGKKNTVLYQNLHYNKAYYKGST